MSLPSIDKDAPIFKPAYEYQESALQLPFGEFSIFSEMDVGDGVPPASSHECVPACLRECTHEEKTLVLGERFQNWGWKDGRLEDWKGGGMEGRTVYCLKRDLQDSRIFRIGSREDWKGGGVEGGTVTIRSRFVRSDPPFDDGSTLHSLDEGAFRFHFPFFYC